MRIARGWLRYHRCLAGAVKTRLSEERLKDFEDKLKNRIGLAQTTIQTRSMHASFISYLDGGFYSLRRTRVDEAADIQRALQSTLASTHLASGLHNNQPRGVPQFAIVRYS